MGWDGEPYVLVDALIASGFLDAAAESGFQIHDWEDYAGRLISQREASRIANANRQRTYRERHPRVTTTEDVTESNALRNGDVTLYNGPTVPNPTQQNHTKVTVSSNIDKRGKDGRAVQPTTAKPSSKKSETRIVVDLSALPKRIIDRFNDAQIHDEYDKAVAWVKDHPTSTLSTTFFIRWLERIKADEVIPAHETEVERLKRLLKQKADEKGLINGKTIAVLSMELDSAKHAEEATAYHELCRKRAAIAAQLEETGLVREEYDAPAPTNGQSSHLP